MESTPLTVEEILETLSVEERDEVLKPDFKVPLELYLKGYNRNQVVPHSSMLKKFKQYARCRVEVKNTIVRNPDIAKAEIRDPIFVVGLARSGTTMFHRLLSCDPHFMAPMLWEMIEPVPPGRPENFRECERYKKASEDEEFLSISDGNIDDRHFIRMDAFEECIAALRPYFLSFFDAVHYIDLKELRDFMYDLTEEQAMNIYENYKKCLQCIFYGNLDKDTKLVLKCSFHCLHLGALQKVFPTAKFVFQYRNARTMIASFSSLIHHIWKMVDQSADAVVCGRRVLEIYKRKTEGAIKFFKQAPKESFLTIGYNEMISRPMEIVEQVYSHFGWNLSPEALELMQQHLQENKKDKYGKVQYTLEEFGISDGVLKEYLKDYFDFFADGPEKLL